MTNGQTGFVDVFTASVPLTCDHYSIRIYYSIRWSDGLLTSGRYTGVNRYAPCVQTTSASDLPDAPQFSLP